MNRFLFYLISLICGFGTLSVLPGCEDHLDYEGAPLPDGISTVNASLGFSAFTPALDTKADGNAIKNIDRLWIVIYDKDNKFVRKEEITSFTAERLDPRPGITSSETHTGHVEFKLTIPNGYYRIYAVANHSLADTDDELIDTPEKLKALDLEWKSGDVRQNSQMFGWFVNGDKSTDHGTDAPVITIRDNNSSLHAWVRRAASKLTIAFDTQDLNDNIYIYLKSITVKDIPKHCYLHDRNTVAADGYTLESKLVQGETICFGNAKETDDPKTGHSTWPVIAKGDTIYGLYSDQYGKAARGTSRTDRLALEHSEKARALYFYENIQPDGQEGTITDKRQNVNGENICVSYPDGTYDGSHDDDGNLADDAYTKRGWKDGKQWGSYVEVQAYYENNSGSHPGKGAITYRFMLGKDTKIDYNAERNHHYRLTMKFRNNANDVDFHIDYMEEAKPGLFTPDTTYVSYLYNQRATTVVRATPLPGYDFVRFEAVILENQWAPYPADDCRNLYNATAWDMQRNGTENYATRWAASESAAGGWNTNLFYKRDSEMANNTEFGFLSLREVSTVTKEFGRNSVAQSTLVSNFRKAYFKAEKDPNIKAEDRDVTGPLNWRSYDDIPREDGAKIHTDTIDGSYNFTRTTNPNNGEINYVGIIPLYTRAKTLDSWAVYSGANPFYEHQRYARVKFIAHYEYNEKNAGDPDKPMSRGKSYSDISYTNVMQARRVDNPRGIYRRYDNDDSFFVSLCYELSTPEADGTEFQPIISRGPWTATIERDEDGLVMLSANGQTATGTNGKITGHTLTPVQFTYKPRGKLTDNSKSRGAIISVTYHNNSCVHKILVRQGYAPHVIGNGTTKWSCFNVYDSEHLCKSPLSVGSLFRRYSDLSYPILEENNDTWGVGKSPAKTDKFKIAGKDSTAWEDIPTLSNPATAAFTTIELYNHIQEGKTQYRLPTFDELTQLGIVGDSNSGQKVDPNANDYNYAYGITYADGATSTLYTAQAYSYKDYANNGADSKCGVRGVIVYSKRHGDNVHFPLGATGHARRKSRGLNPNNNKAHVKAYGYMRYGSVDFRLEGGANNYRPMAWDLPSQKGAAYWTNSGSDNGIAIDFNYGNYMAYYLNKGDLYLNPKDGTSVNLPDALPIRPVHR